MLSGAVRRIVLRSRRGESRCVMASWFVASWSTVVTTRWLVGDIGSTTGLSSGAPGRGALYRIALSPRRIALRYGMVVRGVMEYRGDNPVVGSWHWINHRIVIRCSWARCVALRCVIRR